MTKIILTVDDLSTAEINISAAELDKINAVLDSKFNGTLLKKKEAQSKAAADTAKKKVKDKEKIIRRWFLAAPEEFSIKAISDGTGISQNPVRECLFALANRRKLNITRFNLGKNVELILRAAFLNSQTVKYSPLFSYGGSKSKLSDNLRKQIKKLLKENSFTGYVEPFAGALGSFLAVNDLFPENFKIHLNDINKDIINAYIMIKKSPDRFLKKYFAYEDAFRKKIPNKARLIKPEAVSKNHEYKSLMMPALTYYNKIKKKYNQDHKLSQDDKAVMLVFMLQHCFNGYFMRNSKDQFISWFNYRCEDINRHDYQDNVARLHELFNRLNIEFTSISYEKIELSPETLIYADPPYFILSDDRHYTENFDLPEQLELIDRLKNYSFIYSNYKVPVLQEYIKANVPNALTVEINRIIAASDKKYTEILVISSPINH